MSTTADIGVQRRPQTDHLEQRPPFRIEPSRGWASLKLGELWTYRELLYFLVWRDVKVRYKQTMLGVAWALIQPLVTMIMFSVIFGRLARMPSDGVPYPLFLYAGLIPWVLFSNGLSQSTASVVSHAGLIRKIYFPRLAIPIATVCTGVIDLAIALVVLLGMMLYYGITPTLNILWLPLAVLGAISAALGAGLWLSALNVRYADVRHAVPFLLQLWMFATPIIYPRGLLAERWHTLYSLNPMVGVVEGFRWCLLGSGSRPGLATVVSSLVSLLVLWAGAFYFRRMERSFADIM
jgi:lipopolysaccharide transport system permease protein